ncbi:hypothetical protein ATANTOWER_017941 [Ataeniobius toweri]|uniref:PNPLA domain-containing protein n=1 Tax=Ataeniobius toweri TaxID=208326 RepID=A0ABU7AH40_9TELE|nr:hypothetical protein [Ataeniobius toweri]
MSTGSHKQTNTEKCVWILCREGIEEILPSEAHSLANDRLYVSLTHSRTGRNHIVSRFTSRDELIKALLASSFVPVYSGFRPVEFNGQKWIDGGFTDSLPILPVGRTITVSPFAGLQDVCPVHRGRINTQLTLANMNIMILLIPVIVEGHRTRTVVH